VHEEMQVATVLLGFLFVAISLLVTMPNDVLAILGRTGIEGYFNTYISYSYFITWIILALLISFVVSVVLYLVYLNKWTGLKVARTFFALGLFGSVYLYLFICLLFTIRFFGEEGAAVLNYGLALGDFLLIPLIIGYLVYLWRNIFKRFKILRALKRIRLNQRSKEPRTNQ
jgi:hypothetical protein